MTANPPTNDDEFDEALAELVRAADENGVDVEGGWDVLDPGGDRNWTVEITRVRPDD